MDKGYDNNRVYAECEERGCEPIIPLRGVRAKQQPVLPIGIGGRLLPRIPRHTQCWRALYRGRAAVERECGRLKHDYGLSPLRVRRLERLRLHADLTMLARFAQALDRASDSARGVERRKLPRLPEEKDNPPPEAYLRLALAIIDGHIRGHPDAIATTIENLGYLASVLAKMSDDPGVTAQLEQMLTALGKLRESFGRLNEGLPPVSGLRDAMPTD